MSQFSEKPSVNIQQFTLYSATLAFVSWGAWAFYFNYLNGNITQALNSALTQGILSFIMTFIVAKYATWLAKKLHPLKLGYFLTLIGTLIPLVSLSITLHTVAHTPNILKTIAAPISIAVIFINLILKKVYKELRKEF